MITIVGEITGLWDRVDGVYRALAGRFPDRYVVVDGRRPAAAVAKEVRDNLR